MDFTLTNMHSDAFIPYHNKDFVPLTMVANSSLLESFSIWILQNTNIRKKEKRETIARVNAPL